MRTLSAATIEQAAVLSTLQIGLEWFPDGIGGGSSRFFSTLVDHFESQGVAVHAIVTGRNTAAQQRRDGVRIVSAADASLWRRLRAARAAIRDTLSRNRVDVVASHFPLFTFGCLDLLKHLPLVVHFQGPWAAESRFEGGSPFVAASKSLVEKAVYVRAKRAIVLTRAFRDVLHQAYGVPLERIRVIPGGVDVERFNERPSRENARIRLGLPLTRPIIVAVRRLAKRMGLDDLIAGFARLKTSNADAILVMVGSGRISDALKRQVQEYGLGDSVLFAGRVSEEDLPLYYRAADISIVPSLALEGFGLVVVESLACGTPALVTPIGGLPEVVSGLSCDLVLEAPGSAAIARGLCAALEGRLRLPSTDACAAYAREHFSWPNIARQVKSVYGEVV
jgi:glycosyltransferase involved in cell wall biosynthesis